MFEPSITQLDMVRAFHHKFGLGVGTELRELTLEESNFRIQCMQEELDEYVSAVMTGHMTKQLDALVDLVYFALGTAVLQGFPFNEAFMLVHSANMEKVRCERAEDSLRGSTFDVIKPEGWVAPEEKIRLLLDRMSK